VDSVRALWRRPHTSVGHEWPPAYGNFGDEAAAKTFPDWEPIEGYDDGYPVTCPVEDAGENDWGLVGVGGNAYEWTFEAEGTSCELRGGSFSTNQSEYLHIDNRYRREPSSRLINFGFRPVLLK
jgi:formylglycine-generating enzyme required for sulfatase activity